ncbi:MAG: hypothetical protein H7836_18230 [Magnetococcus sp. YQC-3]
MAGYPSPGVNNAPFLRPVAVCAGGWPGGGLGMRPGRWPTNGVVFCQHGVVVVCQRVWPVFFKDGVVAGYPLPGAKNAPLLRPVAVGLRFGTSLVLWLRVVAGDAARQVAIVLEWFSANTEWWLGTRRQG